MENNMANMDVQLHIEATFADLNLEVATNHVKGHQDINTPKENTHSKSMLHQGSTGEKNLTWQAKLNIQADRLATQACEHLYTMTTHTQFQMLPAAKVYLFINDKPITRNLQQELCNAWTTQDLQEHITEKFKWRKNTANLVD
eukprot:2766280-Ditylum_brightwellii.AAC.1